MRGSLNFWARMVILLLAGAILVVSAPLAFLNRLSVKTAGWLVGINDRLATKGGA